MRYLLIGYQNDPIYQITSHIGPPWENSNSIMDIASYCIVIMAIILMVLYLLKRKHKIRIHQFAILVAYTTAAFLSPVLFELVFWYIALPFNIMILALFIFQNKSVSKLIEEEAKNMITTMTDEEDSLKNTWENSIANDKESAVKLLYTQKPTRINVVLLLLLVVASIVVVLSITILLGNSYKYF